ncbi:MAG: tRNA lysidine(34) synthetase TilS [Candidatus Lambdaproteobacteria bacterium]|nr:tRNA lysidine(34) synthetase TilS [Candidatus Lambdaproteobacteria bacterium]
MSRSPNASPTASPLHPLERRLLVHLRDTALLPAGSRGVVCVSGGGDSVALLRLLHALRERLGVAPRVLHFNHGLRPEADDEARWVCALAATLGVPCEVRVASHLAGHSGVQAAAAAWRRETCRGLLAAQGLDWAATAHQRDDHLESLLLGLLRGRHIANLRGIAAESPPFVRPLLPFTHAELLDYLRARGQGWLEDPSNRSPAYLRNRVRHELRPLLEALSGGALARRLSALERQSGELRALLGTLPEPAQSDPARPPHWIDAPALAALPRIAATGALARFIQARLPGAVLYEQLECAADLLAGGAPTWEVQLPGGRRLTRMRDRIELARVPDA